MSRLTIEITDQQHQSIKALAAMQELEECLKPRIEAVERGEVVGTSVKAIFEEALAISRR